MVDRTEKLLESPSRNDPVYKILQRLFKATGDCHLTRNKQLRFKIRELAQKRFMLGYPPRKLRDNTICDAINWEWIIYCANNCSDDIVIISRDTDYGEHHKNKSFLNDWLYQEFKERVSRKRTIFFTRRLAEGFKLAGISVSEEEEQVEEKFLSDYMHVPNEILLGSDALRTAISGISLSPDALRSAFSGINIPSDTNSQIVKENSLSSEDNEAKQDDESHKNNSDPSAN